MLYDLGDRGKQWGRQLGQALALGGLDRLNNFNAPSPRSEFGSLFPVCAVSAGEGECQCLAKVSVRYVKPQSPSGKASVPDRGLD